MDNHNLDIHSYSLEELLDLFSVSFDLKIEDLQNAKKREKFLKHVHFIFTITSQCPNALLMSLYQSC